MIRIGDKYLRGAAVNAITPDGGDPDNWSNVVLEDGTWLSVNAPAAVVADRVETDEIVTAMACGDATCPEVHDG